MTHYLNLDLLLQVAEVACGEILVRDYGLLESALARPATTVFGAEPYPSIHDKAAALLQSLASNHALLDGNKRLAWMACATFLWINGEDLHPPEDDAFDLVISVANGSLKEVEKIAERLAGWCTPR